MLTIGPSFDINVIAPQPSLAVAVPSAPSIAAAEGLQPSASVLPPVVIPGAVLSAVHVTVRDTMEVLPQASLAIHVLVCEREQVLLTTGPSLDVKVVAPHPSDEVAEPRAAVISVAAGLHPNVRVVPFALIDGGILSSVQKTVLDAVAVKPQASIAVNVLVCEREHVLLTIVPSVNDKDGVEQTSVEVAVPSAASIAATVGLHPIDTLP